NEIGRFLFLSLSLSLSLSRCFCATRIARCIASRISRAVHGTRGDSATCDSSHVRARNYTSATTHTIMQARKREGERERERERKRVSSSRLNFDTTNDREPNSASARHVGERALRVPSIERARAPGRIAFRNAEWPTFSVSNIQCEIG
ncbi:hypothetical protein TSAR_012557, partial [Trichomalopsis sarcophagae]